MDRRTVALGIAAAGAVAAAAVVTIARGHNGPSPQHRAVAAYIEDVDRLEQRMRLPLTNTLKAYRAFSSGGPRGHVVPQLRQAERTLTTLQRRLEAIDAPPEAARLRSLLERLVGEEVAVAREVKELAVFSPRFRAVVASSRDAGAALSRSLASVKAPASRRIRGTKKQVEKAQAAFAAASDAAAAEQADAVDVYDAAIGRALARLRRLDPPAVLAPSFRAQVRTFQLSRAAGAALAAELRKKNRADVAVLGRRFTEAARTAGSVRAQKAQIVAIRAYNRRVAKLGNLQGRIQTELARLQREVG